MTTWTPGQLAMLTLRTGVEKPALRVEPAGEEGWVWHLIGDEAFPGVAESGVTAARPLLVIDPENREQMDSLCKSLVESMYRAGDLASAANGVHPATVIDALRSLAEGVTP